MKDFISHSNFEPVVDPMDSAQAPKLDPPPAAAEIKPLTMKSKRDGKPYARRADVETEIQSMLARPPSSWEVTKLKSETLVYMARLLWARQDNASIGRVIDCLGRRIARIAKDFTGGLNSSTAEEFVVDIAAEVNSLIFATTPSRQSEFLEIAFRYAIKRRAINKSEKLQERLNVEVIASTVGNETDGEESLDFVGQIPGNEEKPVDLAAKAEILRLIPKALGAIKDERHRDAIILHYVRGWPIFDNDKSVPTLCSHFKMSRRQIHNWLNDGREQMRKAMGGEL